MASIDEAVELLTNLHEFWKTANNNKKIRIIKMIAVELFVDTEKTLYIKENAVFEALRSLNCSRWLGYKDSNLGMAESKSAALPLGDTPIQTDNEDIKCLCERIIGKK